MKSIQPLKHISIWGRQGVAGMPAAAQAGHRHRAWGIVLLTVVSFLFTGCAGQKGPETGQPVPRVAIQSITPQETDTLTEIVIEGSDPIMQYTSFQLSEPLRLIVDITDADLAKFQDKITVNKGPVIDITPSQVDNIARLEIALSQSVDTKVYQADGKLMVELAKPVEAAKAAPEAVTATEALKEQAAPAAETAAAPVAGGEAGTAKIVKSVKATATKQGAKVVITADGTMKPNSFMIEGKRLVLDVPGAKSRVRPSVMPVRKGGLDKVRVGQHTTPEQKVRVVLDLTKPMDYTVTPEGNTLVVAMTIAATPKPEEKPQERAASQPQEAAAPAAIEQAEKEAPQAAPQEAAAVPAPQERAEPRKQPQAESMAMVVGAKKYGGRRISLDLQDADLVNVLRLFGELANLNMILAPDVKGKVTVRLVNIPWDQAMEIILKMNGLGYSIEDNIIRIASMGALAKEADEEVRAKEAKKKAEDLVTRIIPINYSEAGKIEPTIKKSLSTRGETVVDARTNTLIVKDIIRNVDEVVALIKQLDKPTPQIMIEARIVEASLTFNRSLGVQWGGNFNASPAYGNATGMKFPNTIAVTGGPTMGAVASGNGNYFVNMPAPAGAGTGGGALGFQFGSLNKALNLDIVLSAMESTGEGKVISTPRVSALDNKEAKIEQGISIPYATSQAGGATNVQFVDAKLSLTVTPHATPDNRIFMKIQATKNAPDNSIIVNGSPSLRKNEAETEMLLADGETAVIGGI
ncbi:MAG: type IV pilus secretin PilQ, partial [Nitrospirae bacterium]|nr:type IV pilus secretin PilQ [Nitrospirota bacterium]